MVIEGHTVKCKLLKFLIVSHCQMFYVMSEVLIERQYYRMSELALSDVPIRCQ